MIRYAESSPPPSLADLVRDLWGFESSGDHPEGVFTLPPDPCISLAVIRQGPRLGVRIVGPHLRPLEVPVGPSTHVCGIRIRPEAARSILRGAPGAWLNRNEPADGVRPGLALSVDGHIDVEAGRSAVLDALHRARAANPAPDALVARAVGEIEREASDLRVGVLAARLGVSTRTLQRRFRASTGLAPKPYIRVRRFLQAAGNVLRARPDAWGRVAAEHGFADQAHFGRECVALTGLTPSAFGERMRAILHVDIRP